MKTIVFERRPDAYLPEIPAYIEYIRNNHSSYDVIDSKDIVNYSPEGFDIIWRFMGVDYRGDGRYIIHDYNSLSAPPFAQTKNMMKRIINVRPNARVFLNTKVKKEFAFHDGVKSTCRNMGVDKQFFIQKDEFPEYDFVYAGSLNRGVTAEKMLEHFKFNLREARLLVIGNVSDPIYSRFKNVSNIVFIGRVPYADVPSLISKARYGINAIPNIYPFNIQAATKVLEYCAIGLPIISTDYPWIRNFLRDRDGKILLVKDTFEDLTMDNVENFSFKIPDVSDLMWSHLLSRTNLFDLLP